MASADVLKKPIVAPPPTPGTAAGNNTNGELKVLELNGHVGFDSLPQQLVQKAMSLGFTFNLLCVGETGIGKTTLMESLFNMGLDFEPCNYELKTVELRQKTYDIEEGNVHLKLTIVETAGFGDQLDKEKSAKLICEFIDAQYEKYLQEELKIKRSLHSYHDTRLHACLYFISPTGHGLKALDVVTMRELSRKVNVIPVIAKADTTSKDELRRFKAKILQELKAQNIDIYRFPEDDDTVRQTNEQLNSQAPFAVVGSTDFVKGKDGKKIRARNYPWGVVEVENEEHCDFVKLREALLRLNVEDLRERTDSVLYEKYRCERLNEMGIKDGDTGPGMAHAFQELRQHREDMERAEKAMKDEFVTKINEKETELKRREDDLRNRHQEQKRKYELELSQHDAELRKIDDEINLIEQRKSQLTVGGKKKK